MMSDTAVRPNVSCHSFESSSAFGVATPIWCRVPLRIAKSEAASDASIRLAPGRRRRYAGDGNGDCPQPLVEVGLQPQETDRTHSYLALGSGQCQRPPRTTPDANGT